jgi:hypothetical protein
MLRIQSPPYSCDSIKSLEQGKIALRGMLFDPIAVLSESYNPESSEGYKFFELWRDLAGINEQPGRLYPNGTCTTYYDAYWQTICCSIIPSQSSLNDLNQITRTSDHSIHRPWHDAWWDWCKIYDLETNNVDSVSSEYKGFEIEGFWSYLKVSINMRRLFMSKEKGWLWPRVNGCKGRR